MKKTFFILLVLFAVVFLSGCQKKSDLAVAPNPSSSSVTGAPVAGAGTPTAIPSTIAHLNDNISVAATASKPATATSTESFILDASSADTIFQQNYAIALDDAQKALKSGVKYCGAKVSFFGATLSETNQQSFIFYSDSFSMDYYWIVTLNGYLNNQKTRAFAAKKDLASELKCMTSTTNAPGTFSNAYSNLIKTEKFKKIDPGTIAQTVLETMDTSWNISVINNAGQNVIVTAINSTATQ